MSKKKEFSNLMDKGDNLWKKSFEPGQNSNKLKRKAKKYYRQADYMLEEASAPKVENKSLTFKNSFNKIKSTKVSTKVKGNFKSSKKYK